jgi:RNA polymerase sigma-70 factor (ECF subfamily)
MSSARAIRSDASDEALMEAYVGGDTRAFDRLFGRYRDRIYRYTRRHLPSDHDAEDVTQQCFLQVHRARATFRPGSRLRPWIFAIARNLVAEHYRRAARRPELPRESFDHERSPVATSPERFAEGRQALARLQTLPPALRMVVSARAVEGQDYEEIQRQTGVRVETLRVRWHRAVRAIDAMMGEPDAA